MEFRHFDLTGPTGRIGNTCLTHGSASIAVVFPGLNGGWRTPAVYYPTLAVLDAGLDALCLEPGYSGIPPRERLRSDAAAAVTAARSTYSGELLMLGKSLGTLAMAELLTAGLVPRDVRTIWLTPLFSSASVSDAIRKLTTPGLVVIGTQDHEYDADKLSSLQAAGGHRVSVLEGAHHGLAVEGDACKSAAIPARLVAEVSSYLAAGAPIARAD